MPFGSTGAITPMAKRKLLTGSALPATEIVQFAAAVPASAGALGAIPEENDEPPTTPCADDMICDLQVRLDASTGAQRDIQEQQLQQQKMMDWAATNELLAQLTVAVASLTTAAQNATAAAAATQNVTAAANRTQEQNATAVAGNDTQPVSQEQKAAQGTAATKKCEQQQNANAVAAATQNVTAAAHRTQEQNATAIAGNDTQPMPQEQGAGHQNPAALMQRMIRFKDHDPALHSETDKRLLTNGPTTYEHIKKNRAHLCTALETGINEPGFAADKAIQDFVAAVDGWLTPCGHSVTVTLMEGSPAVADLDNLCCIAIRCWDRLDAIIDAVEGTGRYDRSMCEHEGLHDEPGYKQFDPTTEEGRYHWMQLRRLVSSYCKCPTSRLVQKKNPKEEYKKLKHGRMSMRQFSALDDKLARGVKKAGVIMSMSDQTRIELVEVKIRSSALEAVEKYKDLMITLGKLDVEMYDSWLAYSNILLQVCSEMAIEDNSDESDDDAEKDAPIAWGRMKKWAAVQPTGARILSREQILVVTGYAAGHDLQFSDVSLETVEKSDEGVAFWAEKTAAARLGRSKGQNLPLAIKGAIRSAQVFPMLKGRQTIDNNDATNFGRRTMNF